MISEQKQEVRIHVRWLIRRDMPEVLRIEKESFEFQWTEEDFTSRMRQPGCIGMVAIHEDKVVGFMIYELHKHKIHILNFAVAKEARRKGVGRQMAEKLIAKLSAQRRSLILLEVRETNIDAILFFRKMGFKATSVLRNYYKDMIDEDAYSMIYHHKCENGVDNLQSQSQNHTPK